MSHETFKVGDRVEVIYKRDIIYTVSQPGWRGMVAAPLSRTAFGYDVHLIEFDNGVRHPVLPECLRKIDDRDDDKTLDTADPLKLVRWTDCPWRPAGVRA